MAEAAESQGHPLAAAVLRRDARHYARRAESQILDFLPCSDIDDDDTSLDEWYAELAEPEECPRCLGTQYIDQNHPPRPCPHCT